MAKFAKLVFGLSYHVLDRLFKNGEEVLVTDEEALELNKIKEPRVQYNAGNWDDVSVKRFVLTDREPTELELYAQVLDETKEVGDEKPAKPSKTLKLKSEDYKIPEE